MTPKTIPDLIFQPEFLKCLADQAINLILQTLPESRREALDIAWHIYGLLLLQAKGKDIADITLRDLPADVGALTKHIWELGGEFTDGWTFYRKDPSK